MSWIKDEYIDGFICPYCGNMVRDNGYGGCDYKFCPHCSREVDPPIPEDEVMILMTVSG